MIENAIKTHPDNGSLKMLSAAFCIEAKQFDKAAQLLDSVRLPALKYTGPNGKELQKHEKLAYDQLKSSIANHTNHLKGDAWLQTLPD